MKCFLDMDGVLVDFMGKVLSLHSADPKQVDHGGNWWGVTQSLGITEKQFWGPIDALGERFWTELEWTEDGREILRLAEKAFGPDNICLLSSPSNHPGSASGKFQWIKTHLPNYHKQYLLGPSKGFVGGPNRTLIDDGDHNIEEFTRAGGMGILIPRPWNSRYSAKYDAVTYLQHRLGVQ